MSVYECARECVSAYECVRVCLHVGVCECVSM